MNNRKLLVVVISTLVFGLLLGWMIFGSSPEPTIAEEHVHESTEKAAGETIWTCSMHPQIRKSQPGQCPICGMDLIPLEAEAGEIDPETISMSPTAMQLANVQTAVVGTMEPVKSVRLNGKVQEDERLVFSQSSHIPGRIEKLLVNFTGEFVRKGEPLAYIYSPELVTAQEELFEAQKIKDTQPQLFKAAREKLRNWKLTERQVDRILQTGGTLENFPVNADISGYVIQKEVNPGDYIQKGEAIYKIADLSKVWVLFDVYESDMPWIDKGDPVSFTVASFPGETYQGKIDYIDPVIDPQTRVAKARVEVENNDLNLKPEMFVSGTVEAALPETSNNIVVPKSAVMWTGKRSVVYVKNLTSKGISFEMREVTLGRLGESYVIEKGLEEGEEIAVNGTFSIDAAAQLAGKPSMMNPDGAPAVKGHQHGAMEAGEAPAQETHKEESKLISSKAKAALQPVYTHYLNFKDALTVDNLEKAKQAANELKAAVDKVNMSDFSGESHQKWMDFRGKLKKDLQDVSSLKNLEEVRVVFMAVSENMIAMTKAFNPFQKALYVQFCPMADNNRGASWLSMEEEIHNPYMGENMPACGEVKETYTSK